MQPLKTPDITPAQLVSLVVFVVGQLVAYGVMSGRLQQLIVSVATTVIPVAWTFADAHIRHGRATGPASSTRAP